MCLCVFLWLISKSWPVPCRTTRTIPQCHACVWGQETPASLDNDACCSEMCHGSNLVERIHSSCEQQRSDKTNESARLHLKRVSVVTDLLQTHLTKPHQANTNVKTFLSDRFEMKAVFYAVQNTYHHPHWTLIFSAFANVFLLQIYLLKELKLRSSVVGNTGPVDVLYVSPESARSLTDSWTGCVR